MIDYFALNEDVSALGAQRTRHINNILQQLSPQNRQFAHLLPLMLHSNEPLLPGYQRDIAATNIFKYVPSTQALLTAKQLFNFKPCNDDLLTTPIIDGLYTIGSLGSLGQSPGSDWDVWVCLTQNIDNDTKSLFSQKCRDIEHWATSFGVELHLFLVSEDQFKQGVKSGLDKESSGSAQHWLLLDEFYRSAITLAGKAICWSEPDARNKAAMLDLGQPPKVPAQEYFGAMLWQLYKGIDSPEKSLLKALLLESYFNDFPNTQLLCEQWKSLALNGEFVDHYLLLLQRISKHLQNLNDAPRLQLVRECFYLKCAPALSDITDQSQLNYQQQQLLKLTKLWQFSPQKIAHLDRQQRWSPLHSQHHHQALVKALLQSYQLMKSMAQQHGVNEALYPQELTILSRKLYSAYQDSDSKINRLATKKSARKNNETLYLRRGSRDNKSTRWLLLDRAPVFDKDYTIHHDSEIIKLLTWVAINRITASNSKLKLPADISNDAAKVNKTLQLLDKHFSTQLHATKNSLVQSSQIEQVLVVINMRDDATSKFQGQAPMMDWLSSNIFSIGSQKHSLVTSIELVYRNSWNEHHALAFTGDSCILDLLSHLFNLIRPSNSTPKIKVYSVSNQYAILLRDTVQFLLKECFNINQKSSKKGTQVKSLVVAGKLYGLFFQHDKVEYKEINNALELYQKLSNSPLTQIASNQPTTSKLEQIIYEHGSLGYVQFFLEQRKENIKVYILDENNHLSSYWQKQQYEEDLIREIYRFYTFSKDQKNISKEQLAIGFNLPQFNRIKHQHSLIVIEPFDRQANELF